MKLPNWFKIVWWLLVTAALTLLLSTRYTDFVSGHAKPLDGLFFSIWIALMLAPLFQEMSFLGLTLKQEIEKLGSSLTAQIGDIRNEVSNAVGVTTNITVPPPVPDAKLPELEARIKATVLEALSSHGLKPENVSPPIVDVPGPVSFLFATRYAIEREVRRLAQDGIAMEQRRPFSVSRLTRSLVETGLIDARLEHAIREVYAVCSPAVHGDPVSEAQVAFVRDVGPGLIAALKSIN